jgi:hypothetical protein
VEYYPYCAEILTLITNRRTLLDGQFDWGGYLLKSNGGVQRFPQHGRQSCVEYKGIREPDCETHRSSRRESGA